MTINIALLTELRFACLLLPASCLLPLPLSDNAARVRRLGIARTLSPGRYTAARVAAELRRLLDDPEYARRAREVGEQVGREDGVGAACDALEELLQGVRPGQPN